MNLIKFDFLSYGAGVQTSAILCLYKEGKISFKKAIFADTGAEPEYVYEHLSKMETLFPGLIIKTKKGQLLENTFKEKFITAPVFSRIDDKTRRGRRVCTSRYKIYPVAKEIRKQINKTGKKLSENYIKLGLGFSTDESHRAKPNRIRWLQNFYPLISLGYDRQRCESILRKHNIRPVRSACFMCPFLADREFLKMKKEHPKDFKKAVEFDKKIRNIKNHENYLHRKMKPLDQIHFNKDIQIDFFKTECETGFCGT